MIYLYTYSRTHCFAFRHQLMLVDSDAISRQLLTKDKVLEFRFGWVALLEKVAHLIRGTVLVAAAVLVLCTLCTTSV